MIHLSIVKNKIDRMIDSYFSRIRFVVQLCAEYWWQIVKAERIAMTSLGLIIACSAVTNEKLIESLLFTKSVTIVDLV